MANFATHLYGGALVSSVASLGLYSSGLAGPEQTQTCFFLGVAGGLLPDIDSGASKPVRGAFTLLAISLAFATAFALVGRLPLLDLTLVWGGTFLLVRYLVLEAFARLTVHRGAWHSCLAVVLVGLVSANAAHHGLGMSAGESWAAGGFVALGYLTHLCLDELASVDLLNHRVRRSFGTALKPFSLAAPRASLVMLLAVVALGWLAPSIAPVLQAGRSRGLDLHALDARVFAPDDWWAGWWGELRDRPN
jgi:hypothetical protein